MKKVLIIALLLGLLLGSALPALAFTPANLAGTWTSGTSGRQCHITIDGNTLIFVGDNNSRSRGHMRGPNSVVAIDWGNMLGNITADGNRIVWANGIYWTRGTTSTGNAISNTTVTPQNTFTISKAGSGQVLNLAGTWRMGGPYNQGKPCSIIQSGSSLTFVNENGQRSAGRFSGAGIVTATTWSNLQGRISPDGRRIDWANGTWWTR